MKAPAGVFKRVGKKPPADAGGGTGAWPGEPGNPRRLTKSVTSCCANLFIFAKKYRGARLANPLVPPPKTQM
jgi:hypothetical protein